VNKLLYVFAVIVGILTLAFVILIYSAVSTPFEKIVVSLLIFILYKDDPLKAKEDPESNGTDRQRTATLVIIKTRSKSSSVCSPSTGSLRQYCKKSCSLEMRLFTYWLQESSGSSPHALVHNSDT
jgi:hypothetical protein